MQNAIFPAIQNLCLAARGYGLGTSITGLHMMFGGRDRHKLGVPAEYANIALIPMGYPKGRWGRPSASRRSRSRSGSDGASARSPCQGVDEYRHDVDSVSLVSNLNSKDPAPARPEVGLFCVSDVPSLAMRERVDGAMVALHFCDHCDGRVRAGGPTFAAFGPTVVALHGPSDKKSAANLPVKWLCFLYFSSSLPRVPGLRGGVRYGAAVAFPFRRPACRAGRGCLPARHGLLFSAASTGFLYFPR